MTAKLIQQFQGHSGSEVYLMRKPDRLFVRKINNIDRNYDRLVALQDYAVPRLYGRQGDTMDIEYIHGLDMRTYLIGNSAEKLCEFLIDTLKSFAQDSTKKNYTPTYELFLKDIDFSNLPFDQASLLDGLPSRLPQSQYHGDLTLENIIWTTQGFYMIDCSSGPWDSWVFDFYKLQQDLECQWFLRNQPAMIENKLRYIQDTLTLHLNLEFDSNFTILMLLRVLKHCQPGDANEQFIIREILKLWK